MDSYFDSKINVDSLAPGEIPHLICVPSHLNIRRVSQTFMGMKKIQHTGMHTHIPHHLHSSFCFSCYYYHDCWSLAMVLKYVM